MPLHAEARPPLRKPTFNSILKQSKCYKHHFCAVNVPQERNDTPELQSIPFARADAKGALKDYGLKAVPTDYSLTRWHAASKGVNLEEMPKKQDIVRARDKESSNEWYETIF